MKKVVQSPTRPRYSRTTTATTTTNNATVSQSKLKWKGRTKSITLHCWNQSIWSRWRGWGWISDDDFITCDDMNVYMIDESMIKLCTLFNIQSKEAHQT